MRRCKWGFLLLALLCLCACTKQESIDVFALCDRFNAFQDAAVLQTQDLLQKTLDDGSREYNAEFAFCPGHTALLSVTADGTDTVTGFQLTVIPEADALDESAQQALWNAYVCLTASFTAAGSTDEALSFVQAAGVSADNIAFVPFGYAGEYDGRQYAVFTGEQYIALFCNDL